MLLPVLLMQVWMAGAEHETGGHRAGCAMDCCAWLVDAGLAPECVCAEDSDVPTQSIPALPAGETGLGKAGQPVWLFADERFQPIGVGSEAEKVQKCTLSNGSEEQPHVRLMVLFCAFLI